VYLRLAIWAFLAYWAELKMNKLRGFNKACGCNSHPRLHFPPSHFQSFASSLFPLCDSGVTASGRVTASVAGSTRRAQSHIPACTNAIEFVLGSAEGFMTNILEPVLKWA
jgi:hypothetical protein